MATQKSYGEYSEFTCEELGIKFLEDEKHKTAGAVGSIEETLNTKTVTKKYKGIEAKTRVKGDGTGELKLSLHMNYDTYKKIYGMDLENLIAGVAAYGQNSVHSTFSLTAKVEDEDERIKYKAYPNCICKDGISRKIENGGEEVAEIEMTISIMPDEYGNGMYEALEEGLDETVKTKWMENFTSELMQVKKL